ncbi:MAG: hypothetical protein TH68_10670 [Candidatus Synechococcus spongiarum 142]|uniref:Uncharacterized protein n=1 Tax=Candidatus Synechococcus spongiarum 142 TaxID=1608213 RepID=A0A6N3X2F7_9SYNE|nr:MAG: hypothetical protein TH68_10670 [Candidatus Synechococcus spongiarum 142]
MPLRCRGCPAGSKRSYHQQCCGLNPGSLLQVLELDGQVLISVAWRLDFQVVAAWGEESGWVLWPRSIREL